jgi:ABC-type multidrug transport system fused ATPase/permease subunit
MRYQVHLDPAIKNLSFSINSGERIAVVGRTGAGKSSLFQLLQGFRQNCGGKIFIDGVDIKDCSI